MKHFLIILFLLTATPVYAGLEDTHNAVVFITSGKGTGSGVIFRETAEEYHVLTAGHVTHNESELTVNFYTNGEQSEPISARLVWSEYDPVMPLFDYADEEGGVRYNKLVKNKKVSTLVAYADIKDLAVIAFKKEGLKQLPKVIPLAKEGSELKEDSTVYTIGCPNGNWPSGCMGKISRFTDRQIWFNPRIIGGRSGSGLFDRKGTKIYGIVVWSGWKGATAMDLKSIYTALERNENGTEF